MEHWSSSKVSDRTQNTRLEKTSNKFKKIFKKFPKLLSNFKVTIEGIGQTAPNTDESFSHLRTKRANPYNPYSRRTSSSNRSPPKRTQQQTSSSREPQAAYSPRQYTRQQPPANIDTSKFDPEATIITECKRIDQTDLGRFSNSLSDRPVQVDR